MGICLWLLWCRKLKEAKIEGVKGADKGMSGSLERKERNGQLVYLCGS